MLQGCGCDSLAPKRLTEPVADLVGFPVERPQKGESDAPDGLFGVGDSNVGNFVGSLVQTDPVCCPIRGAWMRKAISQTDAGLILRLL